MFPRIPAHEPRDSLIPNGYSARLQEGYVGQYNGASRPGRARDLERAPTCVSCVALLGRKTFFTRLMISSASNGIPGSPWLIRSTAGRSFLGNAVELRFTLLQQPQTCLHHLFVTLIFAALKLLGHKLFQGVVFKHDMSSK